YRCRRPGRRGAGVHHRHPGRCHQGHYPEDHDSGGQSMALDLTTTEWQRYARHLALDEIGTSGQLALKNARVLVVGCGGLGSPLALYLAAAGVGNLTLVDGDSVELSNLQRQILFGDRQLGAAKAIAGAERLQALNGDIEVTPIAAHLDTGNGPSLIAEADLVVDCSDNF